MPALSPHHGARACAIAVALLLPALGHARAPGPDWQPSPAAAFDQARRDGRLVLLDVRADWCAACRKMDETGFRDPRVLVTLDSHYVAARGDIDRDPEILRRYGDSGVPAVVILAPDGTEIIRRSGYLEPDWLYWMLVAVADDPAPESHR
jgi:uncharacterized protein YyaL (SSP411 family)